jgi:hypothetical protein
VCSLFVLAITNKNILSVLDRVKPGKAIKIYENFYNDRKNYIKNIKGIKNNMCM